MSATNDQDKKNMLYSTFPGNASSPGPLKIEKFRSKFIFEGVNASCLELLHGGIKLIVILEA